MNIKLLKTVIVTAITLLSVMAFGQQNTVGQLNLDNFLKNKQKIRVVNGSVYANFAEQKVTAQEIAGNLNSLLKLDKNHTFVQFLQREDEIGFTHTSYQEFYKEYAVDGCIIMFHEKDGLLKSVNGNVAALKGIDAAINITDSQAIEIAKANLGVREVFRESTVQTVFAKNQNDKRFYLTKKVRIESFAPLLRYDVFIDANTGKILKKISLIYNTDVTATAQTNFYGLQSIVCDSIRNGEYRLFDNTRQIGTYNGATYDFERYPTSDLLYTNSTAEWTNNPALDLHWGMEKTYDYYLATFNRNSYDGRGGEVFNVYNPEMYYEYDPGMQYNAAAAGYGLMIYGSGGLLYGYNPFVAIDCAAHEFTHMVTDENGNGGLAYQGESGALNESFSDIFGTCIEFYANINPNWTIGEDIVVGGIMRSMSNPNRENQPDTYFGNYWADTGSDYDDGGVHINSGVQNYWFYLLCQGGSGTNDLDSTFSVTAIGMDKAQRIAYRNLTNYVTPYANFIDSYHGSLQSAEDLYGNPSTEYTAVQQAWYAVGIDDTTVPPEPVTCDGAHFLTEPSGTFDDNSGDNDYVSNQQCTWTIELPDATSITLSFSEFDTETDYDFVYIYDSYESVENYNPIAAYSGHRIPASVTSNTGIMVVIFETDPYLNYDGFTATYTSDSPSNVEQTAQNRIDIFPNPANDILNIQFAENQQHAVIEIYDMPGKLIQQYSAQNIQPAETQTFDIANIPAGIYNIRITLENKQINQKVIITK